MPGLCAGPEPGPVTDKSPAFPRSVQIKFSEIELPEAVRRGIDEAGFTDCTPIQAKTLPLALDGVNVAGQAQTGTGKTAAFLIASFTRLLAAEAPEQRGKTCPRMLVLAPTRELAIQIRDEAEQLGKYTGLSIHACYGGVDYDKQRDRFDEPVDILVGTPGRLIDYFKQKVFTLDKTEILVVDEADRLFDMGFIDDVRYIARRMSDTSVRQSFLWSATLAQRVMELAFEHMGEVTRITVSDDRIMADNIDAEVYHVGQEDKFALLLGLLRQENPSRALMFVNMRITAADLADRLKHEGFTVGKLAGDMDQNRRIKLLERFKDGKVEILVATDVASRGLHIDDVSHVFNYDLPQDPEDYVHRIGRTARAGASGRALSIACEKYVYSLEAIEEFVGSPIPHRFPEAAQLAKPRPWRRPQRRPTPTQRRSGSGSGGRSRPRSGSSRRA